MVKQKPYNMEHVKRASYFTIELPRKHRRIPVEVLLSVNETLLNIDISLLFDLFRDAFEKVSESPFVFQFHSQNVYFSSSTIVSIIQSKC